MSYTVFIADDDLDDVEIFCETVAEIDPTIRCIAASNGEEALKKLNHPFSPLPDFIFLDLNMPRLDGKKCLDEIKKSARLKQIPVIVYTTSKLETDIIEMKKLGAVYFITKPSRLSHLRSILTLVLKKHWENLMYCFNNTVLKH
jgi:CheY-like chemotaxis protein